jgi:hypothetical protein
VSPRPGRRTGCTRLKLKHVAARHSAIAKLELKAETTPPWSRPDHDVLADVRAAVTAAELELPGHHLQRAAAENA